jgi:L-fuculose-phosphate aldolase
VGVADTIRQQLISVGRQLYDRGLQTTRSGNISARYCNRFLITRTGANLGSLGNSDLIAINVFENGPIPAGASTETLVHRAIYNATRALAIVHAHPPYAIALAQVSREADIRPVHNEGRFGLKWIPVINTSVPGREVGEDPDKITEQLREACSVIIRGHGAFTVGRGPDEALYKMLLLEDTCKINSISKGLKGHRN